MSTWGFKSNLSLDNNKYLTLFDSTGIIKSNIIGLDTNSNLNINAASGDIYLNSNNTGSETFINFNNSKNVIVSSKLAVGINTTSNINADLTLVKNGFIGINTTQNSNDSFLGLAGSSSLSNTTGSRILLYGNDNTNGNNGNLNIYAGNSSSGSINLFTGNDSNAFQILKTGTSNFSPNGSTIRFSINDINSLFTNQVQFTNTNISTSATTGSVLINGGLGIKETTLAVSAENGGALSIAGGLGLKGNAIFNSTLEVLSGITTSTILSTGITTGDINFTGTLYQDNIPYTSSQWIGTGNTIYYGSGGNILVGINTSNPTSTLTINGDLSVSGITTLGNIFLTNFSAGNIYTNVLRVNNSSYVFAGSCTAGNNVATPTDLVSLILPTATTRSFTIVISVSTIVNSGSNYFTQYTVEGIQTDLGWVIDDYFIGDTPNITFSITSTGQLQYTSLNVINWESTTLRYQATGIFLNTSSPLPIIPTSGNFDLNGNLNVGGNATFGESVTFGGHLIPNINITNDLGSSTNRWRDLYLSGNTIDLGGTLISATTGTIAFGSTILTTTTVGNVSSSIANLESTSINTETVIANSSTFGSLLISNGNLNISGGSLNVSGNISSASTISGFVFTGGSLQISGTTSTGNLVATTAFIPSITTNSLLVSSGNLNVISGTINSLVISTANAYITNNLWVGGTLTTVNITTQNILVSTGNLLANSTTLGSLLISAGTLNISGGATYLTSPISINTTTNPSSITGGGLNVSGDVILSNEIIWTNTSSISVPTFTNRSLGTKIVLYPTISGSTLDYSLGVESNNAWCSSPGGFKWYNNNTGASMQLTGSNLIVTGDILVFGTISDSRLKNNVVSITNGLDKINELRPVTFNWKDDIFNVDKQGTSDSGFIAQEVETIIPHAVSEYPELNSGIVYKNMKHERIIPYLVSSIQELCKQNELLISRIEKLETNF